MIEKVSDTLYLDQAASLGAAKAADHALWMLLELSSDAAPVAVGFYEEEEDAVEALEAMVAQKAAE